jgi:hypothetical protein
MPQGEMGKRRQSEVTLWVNEIKENVWYDLHTKHARIVVQIQQITTLNIILREQKGTIKIPISELDDVIIVNEHRIGHGSHAGFSMGRYFTPNYGSGDYDHKLVGDLVFVHHREHKIAFRNIMDPRSIQNLVKAQKKKLHPMQNFKSTMSFATTAEMSMSNTEFLMYGHESFKVEIPSNWIIINKHNAPSGKFVVVFKNPPLDSVDALSVEIEQNTMNLTIDDLSNLDLMPLKRDVPHFRLVEFTNTFDWAGQTAYKIIYDGIIRNRSVRHMLISTIKNSKLYRLVFICEAEKFFERLPTAIRLIDSFSFATDTHNNDNGEINSR